MTALALPAPDAPASEWGRLATRIPGWRWMPGMLVHAIVDGYPCMFRLDGADEGLYKESSILVHESRIYDDTDDVTGLWPDPDDPATEGCLLRLIGAGVFSLWMAQNWREGDEERIGRACIRVAAALGRWPGGGA